MGYVCSFASRLCRTVRARNENWSPESKDGSHRVECEVFLREGVAFRFALVIVKVRVMKVKVIMMTVKVRKVKGC